MRRSKLVSAVALASCAPGAAGQQLDTSCPPTGAATRDLLDEIAGRGLRSPPDTARFDLGGRTVLVAWKNLLSGRALTLSCAYRAEASGWVLLRARLDEGTHALRLSRRAEPPALIYRDAEGRLLEELAMDSITPAGRTR